ncbi:hypothetical protein [Variovorax sp. UC122_21]|uniref:hypothetical protein n=1 Tax=Variovorax sp. UC122_21 TaxID=3374554 RepID=UPI0037573F52
MPPIGSDPVRAGPLEPREADAQRVMDVAGPHRTGDIAIAFVAAQARHCKQQDQSNPLLPFYRAGRC